MEIEAEFVAAELITSNIVVMGMYRSLKGNFDTFVQTFSKTLEILTITHEKKDLYLGGVFKTDFLMQSKERTTILGLLLSYGFKQ